MKEQTKLLFVCLGNICRSPTAEGIMKQLVENNPSPHREIIVDSAGTYGGHAGELPDSRMCEHAAKRGYNLTSRSREVTASDIEEFDLILAMDDNNYNKLKRISRTSSGDLKIHRMVEFCQTHTIDHVPDPYYSGSEGFELVIDILEDACQGLLEAINNNSVK